MALTDAEKAEERGEMAMGGPSDMDMPDYPWGLRLRLTERELGKMGIDMPALGTLLSIAGSGKVVSTSQNEQDGDECCTVEIVVTDLGLAPEATGKTAAETLYGEQEA